MAPFSSIWHDFGAAGLAAATVFAAAAQNGNAAGVLDRTVLPIPPEPYPPVAGISIHDSVPQVHQLVAAPAGAPNILLVLIDDAGYGQTGTFGAPIPTPNLDRLAARGLRYTRFHVAALCSPSRAALLTGRNQHSVGVGVITNLGTGYPGYDGAIPKSAALVSEVLRYNGYSTAAIGKWHLAPDWESSPTGPFDHWPTSRGFDYFYGFLGGQSDQWNPELCENTRSTAMQVPAGRLADYTLNENLADKAIAWIEQEKSVTPDRPFFVYYAPGATHSPLQAPKAWIDKFKGRFDQGWDRYRETVFERQKQLGVIPPDAELTPRPAELPAWDTLSTDEKKVAARLMEVFAAYMAQTDHEIGRVLDAIAATGQLDNTLVLVIAGDNGASLEGGVHGTFAIMAGVNGASENTAQMLSHLNEYGLAVSSPHYPAAWAWAGNTPFQWGKQIASHLGGTRDPLIVSWPARIKDFGGIRSQFHHLVDIEPTLLEVAHLPAPASVDGVRQMPLAGVSMAYTFDDPAAAGRHTVQYFEVFANRAIYRDNWIAGARSGKLPWMRNSGIDFSKQPWELYDLSGDYSERQDLAASLPGKLKQMQDLFMEEARKYQVFPLDTRANERESPLLRPSLIAGRKVFTYFSSPMNIPPSVGPVLLNCSYTIAADIVVPSQGAEGVIVADGERFGGFTLFAKGNRLQYTYNYAGQQMTSLAAPEKLAAGSNTVGLRFRYDGGGVGKGGFIELLVNGRIVAGAHIPRTAPISYSFTETLDVGEDAGTPVGDYSSPFPFQGTIRKVTFDTEPTDLAPAAHAALQQQQRAAAAAAE